MKKIIVFLILILLCNSCASILNKKTTRVKLSADTEANVVYQKDTLFIHKKPIVIKPIRSKEALKITVLKDSLKQDFSIEPKISTWFWVNITHNYALGMLIDFTNNKRFTYKRSLHFVTDSISNKIVFSTKKVTSIPKNTFFLYTSPLQFLDFFNEPMATLGAEYSFMKNISLSAEYGFKNSLFRKRNHNVKFLEEKARIFRLETKWYNVVNVTKNVHLNEYLALEYREIKSQYNDNITYNNRVSFSGRNFISDDFATVKTVRIFNIKYGILVPISNTFYFDFYTGFGIRTKNFNHVNLEYNREIHQIDFRDTLFLFDTSSFEDYTQKTFFNYTLGFKFGIKL
jgi:hypothetical protein